MSFIQGIHQHSPDILDTLPLSYLAKSVLDKHESKQRYSFREYDALNRRYVSVDGNYILQWLPRERPYRYRDSVMPMAKLFTSAEYEAFVQQNLLDMWDSFCYHTLYNKYEHRNVTMALAVMEVGISHLRLQHTYDLLRSFDDKGVERYIKQAEALPSFDTEALFIMILEGLILLDSLWETEVLIDNMTTFFTPLHQKELEYDNVHIFQEFTNIINEISGIINEMFRSELADEIVEDSEGMGAMLNPAELVLLKELSWDDEDKTSYMKECFSNVFVLMRLYRLQPAQVIQDQWLGVECRDT